MSYISRARKEELATLGLPDDEAMRTRIRSFLLRSGLSQKEFAMLVEFDMGLVSRFLSGQYPGETGNFRYAAKKLMDAHETTETQRLGRTHYVTADYLQVRTAAWNALREGVAYIADGPPGTQKTESFRRVEQEINQSGEGRVVYVYARVSHSPKAFLSECCAAAGIPANGNIDPLLRKLRFFLGRERVLLIVDEAQHLGFEGLEVLRQLLDLPPYFGVILGGSDNVSARLQHWTMEQWRSRVRKTIEMRGPTDAEARMILRAELGDGLDGSLDDAICAQVIAECKARGERVQQRGGKEVRIAYTYTSARQLFGAIEVAKQEPVPALPEFSGHAAPIQQQETVA